MIDRRRHPRDADRLLDDMEQLLIEGVARARGLPRRLMGRLAIDLYDTGADLVVKALIPGARPEDVDLSVDQNTLLLQGRLGYPIDDVEARRVTWHHREIPSGEFAETVPLPAPVEADRATASFADGILTLTLPKEARVRSKRIRVHGQAALDHSAGAS